MENKSAVDFINSLVRNLQVLCHSNVDFSDNVEVIGHIYLSVDKSKKFNYIVNEKVCKNDDSSTVFVSNSFHAELGKKDKNEGDSNKTNNQNPKSKPPPSSTSTLDDRITFPQSHKHHPSYNQMKKNSPAPYHKSDRFRQSSSREQEPFKKFRRTESQSSDFEIVKEEPQISFTAEPVYFQASASEINKPDNPQFNIQDSGGTGGDYSNYNNPSASNQIDLTNIKEEPVDMFNSRGLENLINQVDMQHSQFDQSHNAGLENLHQLSENISNYGDITSSLSSSTTAQQQQQILSLLLSKRAVLTLEDKIKIIKESESANLTQKQLANKFGITQQCVSYVLKKKIFRIGKRPALALEDKIEIIKESETANVTQREVANKFGITQQCVSKILKKKSQYIEKYME